MKGVPGLVIAAAFGIVGAFCNWLYVTRLAENKEKVAFVMIADQVQLNPGDVFKEEHFAAVNIPRENAGDLIETAVLWDDRHTAYDYPATKSYRGGEILLRQDLVTPGQRELSELLAENEVAVWVPVDSRSFVPEKVNPRDLVSFIVPRLPGGELEPATSRELVAQPTEVIGPFRILALGTRTGRRDVRQAAGLSSGPEHVIAIGVRYDNGQMDPKADRLLTSMRLTGNRALQVMLHSAKVKM